MNSNQTNFGKFLLLPIWGILLIVGFWQLFNYAGTPGKAASIQIEWPKDTELKRGADLPTLIVFGHPRCPCSTASVRELERLLPHIKNKVRSYVVFVKPKSQSDDWAKEELWQETQKLPEINTILDVGGLEANRFGAKTSGQVFLYDSQGQLAFHGGITPERGHMGDSNGRQAILSFVQTGKTAIASAPVFGCSLNSPERAVADEEGL
ncbi:MAG: hypothetical protein AB7F59_06210 [Bdellovibrionales bacterium]